jgi:O-antigen ligase
LAFCHDRARYQGYSLYRYAPHNSILEPWAYGGLVGFTALWSMLAVAVFPAARAARHATRTSSRPFLTVLMAMPVARATAATPPWPIASASVPAHNRPRLAAGLRLTLVTAATEAAC